MTDNQSERVTGLDTHTVNNLCETEKISHNDLFTLQNSGSVSDPKPNGYIALCRSVHTAHSQIQIPILTY